MPANTEIIPLKAIYTGGYSNGDVTALGELQTGDKISPNYVDLSGKEDAGTGVAMAIALG